MSNKTVDERYDELMKSIPTDEDGLITGDRALSDDVMHAKLAVLQASINALTELVFSLVPHEEQAKIYNKARDRWLNRYCDHLSAAYNRAKERRLSKQGKS